VVAFNESTELLNPVWLHRIALYALDNSPEHAHQRGGRKRGITEVHRGREYVMFVILRTV